MRRLLQGTLVLGLLVCVVSGCGEPRYGYYGNPGYGYAPYSYGFGRGYSPDFRDHHDWEDHHFQNGHHDTFFRGPAGEGHFGGGHSGGFGGRGFGGGGFGGGGHGGGGHR
jgi:hypothetical protein